MMRRTATLGELCSQDCLEEIARHLQPAAFVPRQTVVSAVHLCDSLCVVTCGRATVVNKLLQDPVIVKTGDVLGLSLFAVHRWLFPVQATAGCDVWSIQKTPFLDILSRHGTLHAMYHQVKKEFSEPNGLSLEEILQRGRNAAGVCRLLAIFKPLHTRIMFHLYLPLTLHSTTARLCCIHAWGCPPVRSRHTILNRCVVLIQRWSHSALKVR